MRRWLSGLLRAARDRRRFGPMTVSTVTGKPTRRSGEVTAFGRTTTITCSRGDPEYTIEELGAMTVACYLCGTAIFIGNPVTLGLPLRADFQPKPGACLYPCDPRPCYVGCAVCTDTIAEVVGIWGPHPTENRGRVVFKAELRAAAATT